MQRIFKYILALLPLILSGTATILAQNVPSTAARPTAMPVPTPANYQNTLVNSIRTWEPKGPYTDPATVKSPSRTLAEVLYSAEYFDGLGRAIQHVTRQASPTGKDLVRPIHLDSVGREQYNYLPYTPKTGTNNGSFKIDAFQAQKAFYQDVSLNPGAAGESVFYGQTEYEKSMLNRVNSNYAPGDSWAKFGGNHPQVTKVSTNNIADSVRLWNMGTAVTPTSTGFYPARSLHKTIVTNPDGRQVVEYKDKDDLVVLRKVQESASPGTAHVGWHCTYYVYDLLRNLRFVIQPKGVEQIRGNWTLTSNVINELCFIYRYDGRQRKIIEKLPGCDSVEFVYNKRDKLAMWRDANLKATGRWKVFRYDGQGREILKALLAYPLLDRQEWEDHFAAFPYSDTSAIPVGSDSNLFPLVQTYYDDYNFPGKATFDAADIGKVQAGSNPYAEAIPSTPSIHTKGMMTGKRVRVEQTDQWLTTTIYYDNRQRAVQTIKDNIAGGKTTSNFLFDFSGKQLSVYVKQTNPRSTHTPTITQLIMTHFDAAGRPDSLKQRINDNGSLETIAVLTYDELGRLKQKRLGVTGASAQLETLNYEYNLQGWLTSINKSYINTAGSTAAWFGEQLSFDSGFTKPFYNGNIAGVHWKTRSDGIARLYGFDYSINENLVRADFLQQNNGSSNWTNDQVDFSVLNLSYDANGNLLSMKQRGMEGMTVKTIDSLKYGLLNSGNKLSYVTDKKNNPQSILGDFKETVNNETTDYTYNEAGFLSKDRNKDIDTILYNHNNKPTIIGNKGRGRIDYQTDGEGNILTKIVSDTTIAGNVTVWTNIEGFTYISKQNNADTLESIVHAEGRTVPVIKPGQPLSFSNEYFIKDHLGSVRTVLATRSDTANYAASMESSRSVLENALFSNIENTRVEKPSGYPNDPTTSPNDYVILLNAANGQKIGPGKALYVMAGDTIQVGAKAFYKSASASIPYATPAQMVASILQSFITAGPVNGVHQSTGSSAPITTNFSSTDYTTIHNSDPSQNLSDKPKAYLNLVAFDNQFNLVAENTVIKQVQGSPDALQNLATGKIVIQKSGFIYVYPSNASAQDVFFDNLVVIHTTGPLAQYTNYYPYGLTMAGISSQAFAGSSYSKNRLLFSGKELHSGEYRDGGSLDWYDFGARMYDAQIGRWIIVDPKANEMRRYSQYSFAYNNPVRFIDPDGMKPQDQTGPGDPPGSKLTSAQLAAKYGWIEHNRADGDQIGSLKNATQAQWRQNPVKALAIDLVHAVAEITGWNYYDNFTQNRLDGKNEPRQIAGEAVQLGFALTGGRGKPGSAPKADVPAEMVGAFSITELGWKTYPKEGNVPRPEGPFKLVTGDEYKTALDLKNKANRKLHNQNRPGLDGIDLHEIKPVKFSGSPTARENKIELPPEIHRLFSAWWYKLQKQMETYQKEIDRR